MYLKEKINTMNSSEDDSSGRLWNLDKLPGLNGLLILGCSPIRLAFLTAVMLMKLFLLFTECVNGFFLTCCHSCCFHLRSVFQRIYNKDWAKKTILSRCSF